MRKSCKKDIQKSNIVCTFNWQQVFRDKEKSRISKFQLITLRRWQRPFQSRAQPHLSSVYCWLAATMVLVLRGTFERRPRNDRRTSDRRQFPSPPHSPPQDNILNKAGFGRSCLRLDNNNGNFGWRFSLWLDIEPQVDTFVRRMLSSSLAVKKCWFAPLKHMIINQSVTSRLETSRYRDFSQLFESIGLGLKNFGLEKSLSIGLENI